MAPVDETTFTTRFVERLQAHLDRVVLRQESQLNLRVGDTAGSFPDIEAVAVHDGTELCVFGEAKGNWHPELLTAIKTQLADRYLTGTRTSTGVYLVAYFASEKWDPNDYRRTPVGDAIERNFNKNSSDRARPLHLRRDDSRSSHTNRDLTARQPIPQLVAESRVPRPAACNFDLPTPRSERNREIGALRAKQ